MMGVLVCQKNHQTRISFLPRPPPTSSLAGARGRSSRFSKTSSSKSSISIFWPVGPSMMYVTLGATDVGRCVDGYGGAIPYRRRLPSVAAVGKSNMVIVQEKESSPPQVPAPGPFRSSTKIKFAHPRPRTFTFEGFFRL